MAETTPQNTRINGVTPSPAGITADGGGVVASGEAATRFVQLITLRRALKSEIETGMTMFRGSILTKLQQLGITSKRTKRGAYADLDKYIVACGGDSVPLKS